MPYAYVGRDLSSATSHPAHDRCHEFGDRLRALRVEVGISQEELAGRSGLHRTYVSSVERGQRNISLTNIHLLADALGVDVRELFRSAGE